MIRVNETLVHSNRVLTSSMLNMQDELQQLYAITGETGKWDEVLLEGNPSCPTMTIEAIKDLERAYKHIMHTHRFIIFSE